jgi:hypothetical protein
MKGTWPSRASRGNEPLAVAIATFLISRRLFAMHIPFLCLFLCLGGCAHHRQADTIASARRPLLHPTPEQKEYRREFAKDVAIAGLNSVAVAAFITRPVVVVR